MSDEEEKSRASAGSPVKLKYRLVNLLIDGALRFFSDLSERQRRILSRGAAGLGNLCLRRQIQIIEANLKIVFPEASAGEIRALRKKNILFLIEFGIDFLTALRNPEKLMAKIDFPEHAPAGLGDEDPAYILALSHLGNFEALAIMYPRFRKKVAAIAAEFGNAHFNELLVQSRSRTGLKLIPVRGAGIACIRALRDDHAVGILMDQNVSPRHGGAFLNFFGLPAAVSCLPAKLARRMKLPMFFGACVRNPEGHFQFILKRLSRPVAEYESDEALTRELIRINEELIRQYPDQYMWLYPRWRYLPVNTPEKFQRRFPWYSKKHSYSCPDDLFQDGQ